MSVISLAGSHPAPRYDALPWTQARIEEATSAAGPFTAVETFTLSPVDADPAHPARRDFTTEDADPASTHFRVVFIDADADESATPPISLAGDGYPTTAALVAASDVSELTGLDPDVQDGLRDAAIETVETYCRQSFTREADVTRLVDGSGGDVLYLPKRLIAATALLVDGTSIVDADFNIGPNGDTIKLVSPVGGSWVTRVRRTPGDPGPAFAFGRDNVSIAGDWGWATCPDGVAVAIRLDMEDQALASAHKLAETVRASRALGVSITQGSMTMQVGSEPGLSTRVKRKLTRYRWRAAGAVV